MSVYPRNLSAFLNRLTGYNKNNVRLNVLGNSSARHGDIIQVELPANSIVDLSSFAWAFEVEYGASGGAGAAHLPINAEALISRLAVEVNGQTLVNITNYNTLYHALLYMSATEDYQRQRKIAQSNTSDGIAAGSCQVVNNAVATRQHMIDSWLGFLGTAKPNFIDTALLGNVRITITLANSDIINGTAAIDRSYAILPTQHFSIDVISITDGVYDSMVDSLLAANGVLEIPFKNYFSFTDNVVGGRASTTFSVASQSIDRLWAVPRSGDYADADEPRSVVAGKRETQYVLSDAADVADILAGGGNPATVLAAQQALDGKQLVYGHPYFKFETCNASQFQFKVNQTQYPNYVSTMPVDWYQQTRLALGEQANMLSGSMVENMKQYQDDYFVYCVSLAHHSDTDERFLSGIDTRGAAAQCSFSSQQSTEAADLMTGVRGAAAFDRTVVVPCQLTIFAEVTSSLRVMGQKVLEVVQ